jgi:hypothetical protein
LFAAVLEAHWRIERMAIAGTAFAGLGQSAPGKFR